MLGGPEVGCQSHLGCRLANFEEVEPLAEALADEALHGLAVRSLTFREVLDQNLRVMDITAITLCMENNLPITVFDLFQEGNFERVVRGEPIGTSIR